MKKEIKVVAIVLAALIIFLSGFGIGATKGINVNVKYEGAAGEVAAPAPTTQAPQTTAPTTQAPQTTAPSADAGDSTTKAPEANAPAGDSKVPATTEEIVAAYNKVLNGTKNYQGKVHIKKDSTVSLQITDCPGGNLVKNIVQPVVDNLAGASTWEDDYENGVTPEGGKFYNAITPGDRDAALTVDAVASASATADGDGYKMTITLKPETSKFDGTNTTDPVFHKQITNPLNLAEIDLGDAIQITAADMSYAGATLNVAVDGEGRITSLGLKMPIEGSGTGKAGPINATIGIAGSLDDVYTMTY
jgi:hypothetical protein